MMRRVLQMFHKSRIAVELLQTAQTLKMSAHVNTPMGRQPPLRSRREAHQTEAALQREAAQVELLMGAQRSLALQHQLADGAHALLRACRGRAQHVREGERGVGGGGGGGGGRFDDAAEGGEIEIGPGGVLAEAGVLEQVVLVAAGKVAVGTDVLLLRLGGVLGVQVLAVQQQRIEPCTQWH